MLTPDRTSGIVIAPDVIDPSDLATRVDAARSAVSSAAVDVMSPSGPPVGRALESLSALRTRLHELQAHTTHFSSQRLHRAPGVRGRVAYEVKRSIRRSTSWYVEPRWMLQQAVNDEVAQLLDATERTIAQLRDDVDDLAMWRRRVERRTDGDDSR